MMGPYVTNGVATDRSHKNIKLAAGSRPTFIDLFAGCGGLSLGLMRAGWNGLFAIEKDSGAFETLSTNLIGEGKTFTFEWPNWLPCAPHCAKEFLHDYKSELIALRGNIDLLVGGPPCQGFSSAGRRRFDDPRNQLFRTYLELVELVQPNLLLLENVRGITVPFRKDRSSGSTESYAAALENELAHDYHVWSRMLNLAKFGVPQNRARYFLVAQRRDIAGSQASERNPFDEIERSSPTFLAKRGLLIPICAHEAISDLAIERNARVPSQETRGFEAISYGEPETPFQMLMHEGCSEPPTDLRLARHTAEVVERFSKIIARCWVKRRLNVSIGQQLRDEFGLNKHALRVLDPDKPAPTVTSMPDDLLHYSEPRTLTVRENARLQTFPDWFEFRGKYTSGGNRRRLEVPRFTQVANAVPPLVAELIGENLLSRVIA